jgi:hypothetical protein
LASMHGISSIYQTDSVVDSAKWDAIKILRDLECPLELDTK